MKPKFQVTIPAKLRKGLDVREGDIMEATVVGDGILLRPKEVVDRGAAADRVAAILQRIEPTPEDARRSEDEIIAAAVADVVDARKKHRERDA
ncbi:MAG: AbrB/MazE/SpoVT family DNA-binding domain-containing protein [Gammaproteobacteria bacterium]|nr:AbrB/MazE/SpoVT family DNA-binding domain-containing protein [Gammaproteobacteria bacterium]